MALNDKNLIITPNIGSTTDPKIDFVGASAAVGPTTITATIYPTNNGTLSFDSSEGSVFSISGILTSGSIFSVNPISGIPIIDVNADRTIALNPFGGNTGIGTTNPSQKLDVVGNVIISGSLSKGSGTFTIPHPILQDKNLVHSFVESPRADLIYRGVSPLVNGIATIIMDEYIGLTTGTWKLLCREPQIFLQNNSDFSLVKGNINDDGILTIISNTPSNSNIDWMVVAERQDEVIKNANWTDENGKPILEPIKF